MYNLLLIILINLLPTAKHPPENADTTFLSKEITKDIYHVVYIDRNHQSAAYRHLLNFKMSSDDAEGYRDYLKEIKKHRPSFKQNIPADLPRQWMPLYRYKGKYYIYSPSEWGTIDRRFFTDSTLVYWSMEAPMPCALLSVKKLNPNTYDVRARKYWDSKQPAEHVIIHIIDQKNKIAIWEDPTAPAAYRYGLYISRQNARNFDMIVNYCKQGKIIEFDFDKINYTALLKNH